MYRRLGNSAYSTAFAGHAHDELTIANSGQLDALIALERIGIRLSFARNDEIYDEGDASDCWYKVISGTVRTCKLLADGRRHIAEFCFGGDCFGIDNASARIYAAEAVDDVIVSGFGAGQPSSWSMRIRSLGGYCAMLCFAISPARTDVPCCSAV
jgi:hypothetical protein